MGKLIITERENRIGVNIVGGPTLSFDKGSLTASAGSTQGTVSLYDDVEGKFIARNHPYADFLDSTKTALASDASGTVTALNNLVNASPDTFVKNTDNVTSLGGITSGAFDASKAGYVLMVGQGGSNINTSTNLIASGSSGISVLGDISMQAGATVDGVDVSALNTTVNSLSVDSLSDVDTSTTAPTDGQALIWSSADGEWKPGTVSHPWTTSGSDIYYNAGNVGIGTNAPLYGLHLDVNNGFKLNGRHGSGGEEVVWLGNLSGSDLEWRTNGTATTTIKAWTGSSSAHAYQRFYPSGGEYWSHGVYRTTNQYRVVDGLDISVDANARIVVDGSSGNVGVRTVSPVSPFHLELTSSQDTNPSPWYSNGVVVSSPNTYGIRRIGFEGPNRISGAYIESSAEAGSGGQRSYLSFTTRTNSISEKMRITADGNVGIGTTTPAATLHVADANGEIHVEDTTNSLTTKMILANQNVIIGTNQSSTLPSATNHIKIGNYAGLAQTGQPSIAIGAAALRSNYSAYNVAIGYTTMRYGGGGFSAAVGDSSGQRANGYGAFIGYEAAQHGTGASNVAIGYRAMKGVLGSTTAGNTVAVGREALTALTTGANNTAVGYQAGLSNTTLGNSTFIGYKAGADNNTANNIFIGFQAGLGYNTGDQAVVIGHNAGYSGSGQHNTYIGGGAGYFNDGIKNVAIGRNAGYRNGAGYNVFVGVDAGLGGGGASHANTVGVGYQALYSLTTGTGNTAVGYQAGLSSTTNLNNTFLGQGAGQNVTGDSNIVIGKDAGPSGTSSSNVVIGRNAFTGSNSQANNVVIGDNAVSESASHSLYSNVIIGVNSGKKLTSVSNSNTLIGNGVVSHQTAATGITAIGSGVSFPSIGNSATAIGTSSKAGDYTVAIGRSSGNSSSDYSVFIGTSAGTSETNSNRLYIENSNSTTPLIYGEFDNDLVRVHEDLRVRKIGQSYDGLTVNDTFIFKPSTTGTTPSTNNAAVFIDRDGSASADVVALNIGSNIKIKRNGGGTPSFYVGNTGFVYQQNYDGNTATNTNPFNNGAGMGIRNTTPGSKVILALDRHGVFGANNSAGSTLNIANPYATNDNYSKEQNVYFRNTSTFGIRVGSEVNYGTGDGYIFRHYPGNTDSATDYRNGLQLSAVPNLGVSSSVGRVSATNGSNVLDAGALGYTVRGFAQVGDILYINDANVTSLNPIYDIYKHTITAIDSVNNTITIDSNYAGTTGTVSAFIERNVLTVRNWDGDPLFRVKGDGAVEVSKLTTTAGSNSDINIEPDGTGDINLSADTINLTDNANTGRLAITSGSISLASSTVGNIWTASTGSNKFTVHQPMALGTASPNSTTLLGIKRDSRTHIICENAAGDDKFIVAVDASGNATTTIADSLLATGTVQVGGNYTLPTADGTVGQAVVTDGSGNLSFATVGGSDTHLGNANLTADNNRTYDADGNSLTFDVNGGDLTINDSGNSETYLVAGSNVLTLGDSGMTVKSNGVLQANMGVEHDEANLTTDGAYGAGADITYLGASTTTVSAGRLYYYDGTTWTPYTSATEAPQQALLGIAAGGTMAKGFVLKGFVNPDSSTLTAGAQVFGATNASLTSTAPTSGYQRILGHAISTSVMYFNPSQEYIELA